MISHKLLRWAVPFLLAALLISNGFLLGEELYTLFFGLQLAFYGLGIVGSLFAERLGVSGIFYISAYFCLMNLGVLAGIASYLKGGAPTTWEEAIPPPVPDDENAAVLYKRAFAHVTPIRDRKAREVLFDGAFGDPEKRANSRKKIAQLLADNAEALRLGAEAAKRPKCRFDLDWSDPNNVIGDWFRYSSGFRSNSSPIRK